MQNKTQEVRLNIYFQPKYIDCIVFANLAAWIVLTDI
jgi:hypothetical protein